jgi:signal transduction histidine kinase
MDSTMLGNGHENKLLRARIADLEREKAELEAFVAMAAHELLEPLVMAEAYTAIVSDRLEPEEHAGSLRDLDALGRGAARTRQLVEALLHHARTSGGRFQARPVDLGQVLDGCVALLAPEIEAREAEIVTDELPEVLGEEALLGGLFMNLLVNALKYSPRRAGVIRVRVRREARAWRIDVDSEGPTIPQEDRARIFEPFRVGRGERRTRGAGLGLDICRRIVHRHGGEIGVAPLNGSGNRFYFTLPDAAAERANAA